MQGSASADLKEANAYVPDAKLMVPAEVVINSHGIAFLFFYKVGWCGGERDLCEGGRRDRVREGGVLKGRDCV